MRKLETGFYINQEWIKFAWRRWFEACLNWTFTWRHLLNIKGLYKPQSKVEKKWKEIKLKISDSKPTWTGLYLMEVWCHLLNIKGLHKPKMKVKINQKLRRTVSHSWQEIPFTSLLTILKLKMYFVCLCQYVFFSEHYEVKVFEPDWAIGGNYLWLISSQSSRSGLSSRQQQPIRSWHYQALTNERPAVRPGADHTSIRFYSRLNVLFLRQPPGRQPTMPPIPQHNKEHEDSQQHSAPAHKHPWHSIQRPAKCVLQYHI